MLEWTTPKDPCMKTYSQSLGYSLGFNESEGITLVQETKGRICFSNSYQTLTSSYKMQLMGAIATCKIFGHTLKVLDDEDSLAMAENSLSIVGSGKATFWAGFTDQQEEGVFRNIINNASRNLTKWDRGSPKGGIYQNCLTLTFDHSSGKNRSFTDANCNDNNFFICQVGNVPRVVTLRGLTTDLLRMVDTKFKYNFQANKLLGYERSKIEQGQDKTWIIYSKRMETIAWSDPSYYPPFGTKLWVLYNSNNETFQLNLNTCNSTEFACATGICLPASSRCNQAEECGANDFSDEENCHLVKLPTGYNNAIPPPNGKVNLTFKITDINQLDVINHSFEAKIELIYMWVDSRLMYSNLKENFDGNLLQEEVYKDMWLPSITFENTKAKTSTREIDSTYNNLIYLVSTQDKTREPPSDNLAEIAKSFKFHAEEVKVTKISWYTIQLECDFQFSSYPFDTQICSFDIYPDSGVKDRILFDIEQVSDRSTTKGVFHKATKAIQYLEYSIEDLHVYKTTDEDETKQRFQKISLVFTIHRSMGSIAIKTFIPTGLLIFISQLTTYFLGEDMFDGIIAVNATVLMTLATLFVDSFNSMPTTPYIK